MGRKRRGSSVNSTPATPPASPLEIDDWCNACSYQCPFCPVQQPPTDDQQQQQQTFHSHALLREHLHTCHPQCLKPEVNLSDFVSGCRNETRYVICAVCRRDVIRDKEDLTGHFKRHGKTVEDYYSTYVKNNSKKIR